MEAKQLKSEADASQGTSKHRRVKHRRVFRKQSDGGSPSHLVKCNMIKKKHVSREADASQGQGTSKHRRVKQKRALRNQSGGGSLSHLVKCNMIKKKHVSREQQETDASEGGSEHPQVDQKEVSFAVASDAAQQHTNGGRERVYFKRSRAVTPSAIAHMKMVQLKRAELALKFYEKNQVGEFEVVDVLDLCGVRLKHPEQHDVKFWVHISFTAKSKNADSGDVSPKHFFGELYKDYRSGDFKVTYCSTFEPSDDPGFDHGCVFCSPDQKFHPADGYAVGRPPWYIVIPNYD